MQIENFKKIETNEIAENAIKLIGNDWMLITAGDKNSFNTMTAAWGGMGFLWNKAVVFAFVRPQRYTFEFTEKNTYFSLSFFDKNYKDVLQYCGKVSGRDENKVEKAGLHSIETANTIAFQEARLIIECKTLYKDWIKEEAFQQQSLLSIYKEKDYHMMYIAEITAVYEKNRIK